MDGMRALWRCVRWCALSLCVLLMAAGFAPVAMAQEESPETIDDPYSPSQPPPELRWHRVVAEKDGETLYYVTEIVRMTEERDENVYLIRDVRADDVIYRTSRTYGDKSLVVNRLSTVDGRSFIEMSWEPIVKGKTRTETMKLFRENEALLRASVDLHLKTNGGSWTILEDTFERDLAYRRQLVRDTRTSANTTLLEMLERMRSTLFDVPEGVAIKSSIGQFLLYDAGDFDISSERSHVLVRDEAPDCDFDDAFGYPCTDSQKERIAKAHKNGKQIFAYW
ncbi:MAG: hypothetical protein ACTHQM_26350 [Thermoanaerobaculia bacterium]